MDHRNTGEYHKADPAWRRRMQIVLGAAVVVGVALLVLMQWWLARVAHAGPAQFAQALHQALGLVSLGLGLVGIGFAVWLYRLALATAAERRWPPSHMRTSADVRIRYLTSADSVVVQMKAGAVALALLATGLLAWGGWLLRSG